MGSAGLRRVRERFSVERMVQDTLRVYAASRRIASEGSPRYGSFSAVSPGRQPECVREQSSKVTAAPLPENVTPRAIRARRRAVGLDQVDRAKVGAGVRVEDAQLVAVDEEPDAAAVRRPGDLVGALGVAAQRLDRSRGAQVRPDIQRLAETGGAATFVDEGDRVARGRRGRQHRAPSANQPARREPGGREDEGSDGEDDRRDPRAGPAARPAHSLERTLRVSLPAAEAAGVHHADVAERKIEPDRIVRIDGAQRRRDVRRHPPARRRVARQSQAAAEPDDVRVERHDQLCRRDRRPDAEIHLVAPHHPAEEQVQPLARAAGRRARKEIAHAAARRKAPAVRRAGDRAPARGDEKLSSAPPTSGSLASKPSTKKPSIEPDRSSICRRSQSSATRSRPRVQRWTMPRSATCGAAGSNARTNVAGRAPRMRDERLDGVEHAGHAPERQRRGAEADDLAVRRVAVAPDDLDRIGRGVLAVVVLIERVQPRPQRRFLQTSAQLLRQSRSDPIRTW